MEPKATEPFDIKEVIDERLIVLGVDVHTKLEMLNYLTDLLEAQGRLNDRKTFFDDVLWREEQGDTGIGMGVAIPHGKSSGVSVTSLALGVSCSPLCWGPPEDEGVNVVILFAVTDADSSVLHLKLLQHVARLLAHGAFVEELRAAATSQEVLALLESDPSDWDERDVIGANPGARSV